MYKLTPKPIQHGQSKYEILYPRRPKTDVAKFENPSPSTAGREAETKPKLNSEKHNHKTEFHPPTTSMASHCLLENYSQGIQSHMFFKVKLVKIGQFKTPAR
jgi:hypothetical protein